MQDVGNRNIEIVKVVADYGRAGRWDLIRPLISDDIVMNVPESVPWGGKRYGWQGYQDTILALVGNLDNITPKYIKYFAIGEDEVLLRTEFSATLPWNGRHIDMPALEIFKIKAEKISELSAFYFDTSKIDRGSASIS